jgi:saccharopine dehydrogenase (NAD+, L-lysine-forming)
MRERKELAGEILTHAKPPVDDDIVYVHVASEGRINEQLQRHEYVREFKPRDLAGSRRTAIAWTTAGSVVAVIEMVSSGLLPHNGFLKQEEIPFDAFLSTKTGSLYAVDD